MPAPISNECIAPDTRPLSDKPPRVLLVEDNFANTLVAKALLRACGVNEPDVAENGLIALEFIKGKRYDVIFMDCMMPEMDGFEATRAIRSGQAGSSNVGIPIVALTANAMSRDRDACRESGMSDFLAKPVERQDIARTLEQWVGREHGK